MPGLRVRLRLALVMASIGCLAVAPFVIGDDAALSGTAVATDVFAIATDDLASAINESPVVIHVSATVIDDAAVNNHAAVNDNAAATSDTAAKNNDTAKNDDAAKNDGAGTNDTDRPSREAVITPRVFPSIPNFLGRRKPLPEPSSAEPRASANSTVSDSPSIPTDPPVSIAPPAEPAAPDASAEPNPEKPPYPDPIAQYDRPLHEPSIASLASSCKCPTDVCDGCRDSAPACNGASPACDCPEPACDCPSSNFAICDGGASQCGCDSCGDACCDGQIAWYAQIDALIVTRNNASRNQPVMVADDTGDTVLSTRDLSFGISAGPRVFVGRQCCGDGLEFGYFGAYGGAASARAEDPGNLDIPDPLGALTDDFQNADVMTLRWTWTGNNAEANWYRGDDLQWLIGVRFFSLEEQFNIQAQDSDGDVSDYHLSTSNNLIGAQIGARLKREGDVYGYGIVGKAGILGNDALERQRLRDDNNTDLLRFTRKREARTSFIGDLDLYGTVRLNDYWRVRGGYYLFWLTQVALAPDQLDFRVDGLAGRRLHGTGSVFMHGATAGLEAAW